MGHFLRKPGSVETRAPVQSVGFVAPEALFLRHLKHFIIRSALNASPDVSPNLLFIVKQVEEFSMELIFFPLAR